ncbi:hypothetical protein C9374_013326 [Naegleria lovaniensis]|uniref:SAC domain-containing protein n=1 Tax=Naegleria lovaniensis TaxID=51637 RepID=A0AA88H2F5_NAELO|nr:uncharacterized protein C9374_013326 [Naegleria lovaniensis]KAG2391841.1 hypothetical protein C9374_013326 [Naegleria lovaniensis]
MRVCEQYIDLLETSENFILRGKEASLQINRSNNKLSLMNSKDVQTDAKPVHRVSAVLGSIQLLAGRYLIVVKESVPVAKIDKIHTIYCVSEVKIIPYYQKPVSPQHSVDESKYLELLTTILNDGTFYFSYTYDATISTQNWFQLAPSMNYVGEKSDEHFLWNGYLASDFTRQGEAAQGWFVPLIRGFVETKEAKVGDNTFSLTLLSRKGCKRVGTRYNIRGADILGNVANFVETEQIVEYGNHFISFIQVRGSIPLIWSQKANIQYKPPFVMKKESSGKPFEKHFDHILDRYSNIVMVNLVNQKGSEKKLADEYHNLCNVYNKKEKIKYIAFDFHHKCKSMNYSAISELTDQVEPLMKEHQYFHMNTTDGNILKLQTGIIRSNCIDCLDRTNVCQSVFAKIVLTEQLHSLKLLPNEQKVTDHKALNHTFQNIWADHGDRISLIYAGTGAIKADFTRTGTRTWSGLLNDGVNSITRYYLNNFKDGIKQDSVNLLLGKYIVKPSGKSPFEQENQSNVFFSVLKYGFFVSLFMLAASASKVPSSESLTTGLLSVIFYLAITVAIYFLLVLNGRKIVNNPCLVDDEEDHKHK